MLTELGEEWMNKELQPRHEKYKKVANRSHRAKKKH